MAAVASSRAASLRTAPGPRGVVPSITMPTIAGKAPHLSLLRDGQRYGEVVRYTAGPIVIHALTNPDHIKHVLQENHANYEKGRGVKTMRAFLGDGLLTSEGGFWKRQRRMAQPAFHRQRLMALTEAMVGVGRDMVERFEPWSRTGEPVNVADEMARATLGIVGLTLFGVDPSASASAVAGALTVALDETNRRTTSLVRLPLSVPTPRNRAFRRALKVLDDLVYGIIARRRAASAGERAGAHDLLSMLMESRDEDTGEAMSDKQLRDEVMTIVLAGHETTANALAWTFYLLSEHPEVFRKLRAEVTRVLDGRAPTFEDLASLKYTRMVLEEAMRLYPPAWIFGRTAIGEDALGSYRIPAKSLVVVSPYCVQRTAKLWPNPEGFEPERFSAEATAKRHKFAYLPFGAGPRVCIGNQFAIMEAQVLLAMMVQRYRLDLAPGFRVEAQPMVTLRPKYGISVNVRPH